MPTKNVEDENKESTCNNPIKTIQPNECMYQVNNLYSEHEIKKVTQDYISEKIRGLNVDENVYYSNIRIMLCLMILLLRFCEVQKTAISYDKIVGWTTYKWNKKIHCTYFELGKLFNENGYLIQPYADNTLKQFITDHGKIFKLKDDKKKS
ncbi:signal peptidase complex subunit 2, putative (SPC2) [Plasmodium ovale wallikeri]|uniref:Signal peptidase complex subunit 2, putative (SPC2) n=1 Tax=Plasmodium ovale wallikeri TaxID=864142 RepID=A0A1A8YS70_PLAOA|nr:signal peptidase complex subunit 2, putative (SPC2) [Plasmodium ovale wallikeri]SBT34734.1 signal peptidase complex subunit 2, putative (SPC2) [Plasmodium ovale wallikeri]